jgi:hypothetical protein
MPVLSACDLERCDGLDLDEELLLHQSVDDQ